MMVEYRRKPRKGCKIPATIRSGTKQSKAYVVDLNEFGVRLLIENSVRTMLQSDEIEVHTQELGVLKGKARWHSSHRIGIELCESADTLARYVGAGDSSSPDLPPHPSQEASIGSPDRLQFDELLSEERKIADQLARVAEQPDMFTKAEMAELMEQAAEKIRRGEKMLTSVRALLLSSPPPPLSSFEVKPPAHRLQPIRNSPPIPK